MVNQLERAVPKACPSAAENSPVHHWRLLRPASIMLLILFGVAASSVAIAQQCGPTDIIALSKAGYTKQDINALCRVDVALLDESGRLDLSVPVMNQFLEAILPLQLSSTTTVNNGVLRGVRYCGATSDHAASLVAYGTLLQNGALGASVAGDQTDALKGPLDCSISLDANRQHQTSLGVQFNSQDFFAKIAMVWAPWDLRFTISSAD